MRGLPIRQPHIDMILDGHKTWEMRSGRCNFRERIALIQSGTKTVVGAADVIDCIGPLSDEERLASSHRHGLTPEQWGDPELAKYRFAWVLANIKRLAVPIPYRHNLGATLWVTLSEDVEAAIALSLGQGR